MRCGLFGKLPAKRDFIALNAPTAFLAVYETWLQAGITASRMTLGGQWQQAFLNAPIWRFWLGAAHCGTAVAGAFMPSVDGIGRYFPLTVFALPEPGGAIPPPELDPQESWYAAAEEALLAALEPEASYESVSARVGALPGPSDVIASAPPADMARLSDGTIVSAFTGAGFPERLSALRIEDHGRAYAHGSCFWTAGGENFEPLALVGQALPNASLFAGMLTGRFDTVLAPAGGHA